MKYNILQGRFNLFFFISPDVPNNSQNLWKQQKKLHTCIPNEPLFILLMGNARERMCFGMCLFICNLASRKLWTGRIPKCLVIGQ